MNEKALHAQLGKFKRIGDGQKGGTLLKRPKGQSREGRGPETHQWLKTNRAQKSGKFIPGTRKRKRGAAWTTPQKPSGAPSAESI